MRVVGGVVGADEKAAPWRMASMALAMRLLRTWRMSFSKQSTVVADGVGGFDGDAGVGEPALIEVEDCVDEILQR